MFLSKLIKKYFSFYFQTLRDKNTFFIIQNRFIYKRIEEDENHQIKYLFSNLPMFNPNEFLTELKELWQSIFRNIIKNYIIFLNKDTIFLMLMSMKQKWQYCHITLLYEINKIYSKKWLMWKIYKKSFANIHNWSLYILFQK